MPFIELADEAYQQHDYHDHQQLDGCKLPALYGGSYNCFAMVVLQDPSLRFTKTHWHEVPVEDAATVVNMHREIFLQWVQDSETRASLFTALAEEARPGHGAEIVNNLGQFFTEIYITDVWKCGKRRCVSQSLELLRREFVLVNPQCMILMGNDARDCCVAACRNKPHISIPFPGGQNQGSFAQWWGNGGDVTLKEYLVRVTQADIRSHRKELSSI